jgi:hypothetical protein
MARKVLLFTTVDWMSTARYAHGFVTAGWTVEAIASRGTPVTLSRYVARLHRYRPLRALASLRRALETSGAELVLGCDDRAVALMLRLYDKELKAHGEASPLAALIRRSLGRPESFAQMISRGGSMQAAVAAGIRTPETVEVADEAALERVLARFGYPAVLKVDGSWGGDGVALARTRDEALAAFAKLRKPASRLRNVARALRRKDAHFLLAALMPPKRKISVQRFVAGHSAASAFACWNGEVIASLYYDVLVADGAIGPPNVIRRVDCPEMEEASRRVARRFGLTGIYGLDFIRDREGRVHLIEINPRPTQGGTLPFGDGRDLPSALAARAAGGPAPRREAIPGDVVAFFPAEWQRDPASPYLMSGHHNVPWDDPAVLKNCFVPHRDSPARKAAIEMLLTTAPESAMRGADWHRAWAG